MRRLAEAAPPPDPAVWALGEMERDASLPSDAELGERLVELARPSSKPPVLYGSVDALGRDLGRPE
jgi:hypothetical protein